jgi:hypothetical protein
MNTVPMVTRGISSTFDHPGTETYFVGPNFDLKCVITFYTNSDPAVLDMYRLKRGFWGEKLGSSRA